MSVFHPWRTFSSGSSTSACVPFADKAARFRPSLSHLVGRHDIYPFGGLLGTFHITVHANPVIE